MAIFMITYDLKKPGRDYSSVHEHIKENYAYCKGLESFWLVESNKSAAGIRDELSEVVDSNDVIFVARLGGNWASWNYGCADWLKSSNRSW